MKNLSKKQITAAGVVAILAIGGITVGVINHHNQNVQAQQVAKTKAHEAKVKADKKAKAVQLAKEKEAAQQKQVATLLATATANPSDNSIKAVNDAIAKLTDQKAKAKNNELVKALNAQMSFMQTMNLFGQNKWHLCPKGIKLILTLIVQKEYLI